MDKIELQSVVLQEEITSTYREFSSNRETFVRLLTFFKRILNRRLTKDLIDKMELRSLTLQKQNTSTLQRIQLRQRDICQISNLPQNNTEQEAYQGLNIRKRTPIINLIETKHIQSVACWEVTEITSTSQRLDSSNRETSVRLHTLLQRKHYRKLTEITSTLQRIDSSNRDIC